MKLLSSTIDVPFNFVYGASFAAATSSSLTVKATTAFDTLLGNVGTNFELYRFSRLAFKALAAGTTYAFTYYPTDESPPATDSFVSVSLAGLNRVVSASTTVSTYLDVPKPMLYQTPEDWYSVNPSGTTNQQGRFVIATPVSYTGTIYIQISGMCQFKAPSVNGADLKLSIPKPIAVDTSKSPSCSCSSHEALCVPSNSSNTLFRGV